MNKLNHQPLHRFRWHFLLALLTFIVVGVAYFASAKSVPNDFQSSTAIHEVSDYARDYEDNTDDDPLFIITALLNQSLQVDWTNALNTHIPESNLSWFSYRARSRSPPRI